MPEEIAKINVAGDITINRQVSAIQFLFHPSGAIDMVIQFDRVMELPGLEPVRERDGSLVVPYAELVTWPEFPATYLRIKNEAYARRAAQDAQLP